MDFVENSKVRILHIVPAEDESNGVWRLARLLSSEDGGRVQTGCEGVDEADEIWVHGMWLPREWVACRMALRKGKRLVRMTHGSLSPICLERQGKWKKRLVGPIERYFLRRADKIVATCEAEKNWIQSYLGKRCPQIEMTDIKRFFNLNRVEYVELVADRDSFNTEAQRHRGAEIHLLYLGRRHPLKGLEYLEAAVRQISSVPRSPFPVPPQLKVVSNAFGEEKERVWEWCDVLVLPTLSENFGLVVAEALERGKRVITTDGAPAWGSECKMESVKCKVGGGEIWSGYYGRLIYLKGYRDGTGETRVALLKEAIEIMNERGLGRGEGEG